ncbi:MAG: hypothetical protein KF784_05795 [Fimbriimonadaceae bacterium]|nr:hypothetical protein [Fimbriimonadaceae bacterium]
MTKDFTFGDFLLQTVSRHSLSKTELYKWIRGQAKGAVKTPESIRERLAYARKQGAEAWEFPFFAEIVSFFEHHKKHETASRIQHIVFQQMHDLGMIDDVLATDKDGSEMLRWLMFPPVDLEDCREDVNRWIERCTQGDHARYRQAIALYELLEGSPTHKPIRKFISVDLARIALYNGDYSESFRICRIIEQSWQENIRKSAHPAKSDVHRYLRALRILAMAVSSMFSYSSFEASDNYFRKASIELEDCLARGFITELEYWEHLCIINYRRLRMFTRLMTSGNAAHVQQLEAAITELEKALSSRDKVASETRTKAKPSTKDRDHEILLKESAPYDTLERAYALIAAYRFEQALEEPDEDAREAIQSTAFQRLEMSKQHGDAAVKHGGLKLDQTSSLYTDTDSILGFLRASTTRIIVLCAKHMGDQSPSSNSQEEIKNRIRDIFDAVGPTMHRHSQESLTYVARYVDRVFTRRPFSGQGGATESLRYYIELISSRTHLPRLEQESRVSRELLFEADSSPVEESAESAAPAWDEQKAALILANRFSTKS